MSVEAQIHGFQNVLIFGTEDSRLVAIEKELLKHDSVFNTEKIEYITYNWFLSNGQQFWHCAKLVLIF